MNADQLRQVKNNSGKLYDFYGNSSVGGLPKGEIVIRDARKQVVPNFPQKDVQADFMEPTTVPDIDSEKRYTTAKHDAAVALSDEPVVGNFLNEKAVQNPAKNKNLPTV